VSEQPKRRRRALFGGLASVALVTGGAVAVLRAEGSSANGTEDDADGASDAAATTTAEVTKRDLEERQELSGTLGYGDSTDLALQTNGTITALPTLGTVVARGDTLVEVNGLPITLWYGDRPLWRELSSASDDGPDIEEIEANLVALGYGSDDLTVDQDWTALTAAAVKDWQEAMGYEETGTVGPGDVALTFGAVRVSGYPTAIGGAAAGPVATVTSAERQVTIDLDATKQSLVAEGQGVEVELPDGTVLDATVTSVGTVATSSGTDELTGQATDPTIAVTITLDDASQAGTLDESPVTVRVVTSSATDVLAVPVDALLALAEGGYAVERVGTGTEGDNELLTVDTGAFADGWVEVSGGDIAEGDEVVVPG
jgi:peptidoglycan hydrolase-like protein with peptidoglycan-binding domain